MSEELYTPRYLWIGNVSKHGNCRAVRIEYLSESLVQGGTPAHYNYGLDNGQRWRYVETANVVMWYQYPNALQREAVRDFFQQRNIFVNRHMEYGRFTGDMEEENYDCDLAHGHFKLPDYYKKIKGKPRTLQLHEV